MSCIDVSHATTKLHVESDGLDKTQSMTDPLLSVDTVFELLQNERRRYLLYCLDQDADEVVSVDELTAMILDRERQLSDGAGASNDSSERRVRSSLHHNHLPRLEDVGLIEYDPRSETVRNSDGSFVASVLDEGKEEAPHLRTLFCTSPKG